MDSASARVDELPVWILRWRQKEPGQFYPDTRCEPVVENHPIKPEELPEEESCQVRT